MYHKIIVFGHHYLNCVHLEAWNEPIEANVSIFSSSLEWPSQYTISKLVYVCTVHTYITRVRDYIIIYIIFMYAIDTITLKINDSDSIRFSFGVRYRSINNTNNCCSLSLYLWGYQYFHVSKCFCSTPLLTLWYTPDTCVRISFPTSLIFAIHGILRCESMQMLLCFAYFFFLKSQKSNEAKYRYRRLCGKNEIGKQLTMRMPTITSNNN